MSDTESEYYDSSDELDENNEICCKNLDPSLARMMGIFVEEQKSDWKPPSFSGLHNSERIVKLQEEKEDIFEIIKSKISNYDKLSNDELDIMTQFSPSQKLELVKVYNDIVNSLLTTRK